MRVLKYAFIVVISFLAACAGAEAKLKTPVTAAPPAHSLLFDSDRTGNFEVYRLDGTEAQQLTNDKHYDSWWAKASPDGREMLFYRTPKGVHDRDYGKTSLWKANIDGSNAREIIPMHANGWSIHGHADWYPDGTKIVMFGGADIWITDAEGHPLKNVTKGIDPSWSPNGSMIIFISCGNWPKCKQEDWRVFAATPDGGNRKQLETAPALANDPYISPDGQHFAWITRVPFHPLTWNLVIAGPEGVKPLVADGNINSKPDFAPDGTVYFHKTMPGVHKAFGLWSVQMDGSNLTWVSQGQPGSNEFPNVIPR